jgi:hypothetical protein
MGENINTASPTGRLLLAIMGSFAQFERSASASASTPAYSGRASRGNVLGRRRERIAPEALQRVAGLSVREAAKVLGVPASRVYAERQRVFGKPAGRTARNAEGFSGAAPSPQAFAFQLIQERYPPTAVLLASTRCTSDARASGVQAWTRNVIMTCPVRAEPVIAIKGM